MNTRDFCFWLQGYCELTEYTLPSNQQLDLIIEHLELTKDVDQTGYQSFDGFCLMLDGFFTINGSVVTDEQWSTISSSLKDVFTKVTSELDDGKENDIAEIIKDVLDEHQKTKPLPSPPPFIPPSPNTPWRDDDPLNPWTNPLDPFAPRVVCSDGSGENPLANKPTVTCESSKAFCASSDSFTKDLSVACSSLDAAYDAVQLDNEKLDNP